MPSPTTARPLASTLNATAETPLFFECAGRPLYAVHYPARTARPGAPLLVVCHSLGVEQLTVYRSEVQAARAAAEAGVPAFHHHARGHGDSAGDFADVTFEGLVEDALGAAREGLERSPARGVAWLGVRFGALVAALEARGVRVQTVRVGEEPGWHFISNPAWEAPALIAGTREWLRALA